jgi:hypothetical protein
MGRKLEDELLSFQCLDVKLPTLGECGEGGSYSSSFGSSAAVLPRPTLVIAWTITKYVVVWTITLLALLFIDCVMKAS